TPAQQTQLELGAGTYSNSVVGLQTTGTAQKVGYAFAYGQNVSNGPIDHRLVYNAPYGNALGCTPALIATGCGSYIVDQQTVRRSGVLTLRYDFDPTASVTLTGVTMHAWDDGSGNGANDWLLPQFAPPPPPVVSGAQGSGPVWLATAINDGELRISKRVGEHLIVLDGFRSYFTAGRNYQYNIPPAWNTESSTINGFTLSDQIFLAKHTLGFGYYAQGVSDYFNGQPASDPSYRPFTAYYVNSNVFLQDEWQATQKLSVNGNLWLKRSQLVAGSHLDPRLAFVYRPSSNDVVRLSLSGGQTYPSAYLRAAQFNPIATVNFICGPPLQAQIGIGPSSTAQAETSRDIELGYGHRFANSALIQANLYDTVLFNQLLGTNVTAASLGSSYLPPGYLAQLNAKNPCGGTLSSNNVVVNVFENLGRARYHGVESNGSYPLQSHLFLDWSYDIQIATPSVIDPTVYANSPGLIIGTQYYGVPMHKGSLALRADNARGISGQLVGYFTSQNNLNNLPGYVQVNGDVGADLGKARLSLGAVNILNKAPFDYGLQFIGSPQYQQPGNPMVPTELFGLPHPSVFFKYELRVR
ncbi:MAG: TonB-dependent receptor, partial [Candidatus Eremiobacteraeota bacterium]|nr:TonB-dependent receptor [Candidatus Eremiobacteraeota bacterium]